MSGDKLSHFVLAISRSRPGFILIGAVGISWVRYYVRLRSGSAVQTSLTESLTLLALALNSHPGHSNCHLARCVLYSVLFVIRSYSAVGEVQIAAAPIDRAQAQVLL